jgi:hypothetical protein
MPILRSIKSNYKIYENQKLECLVAIENDDCKTIKTYFKKHKGKKDQPNDTVSGYKFVNDPEFDSLKIDFEHKFEFIIKDLVAV